MSGKLSFLSLLSLLLSTEAQLYPGGQDYIKSMGRQAWPLIFCSDCSRFHNTKKQFEHGFFPIKVQSTVVSGQELRTVRNAPMVPLAGLVRQCAMGTVSGLRGHANIVDQLWIRRLWTLLSLSFLLIENVTILRCRTGHLKLRYISPQTLSLCKQLESDVFSPG